jgi:hypothetical protein
MSDCQGKVGTTGSGLTSVVAPLSLTGTELTLSTGVGLSVSSGNLIFTPQAYYYGTSVTFPGDNAAIVYTSSVSNSVSQTSGSFSVTKAGNYNVSFQAGALTTGVDQFSLKVYKNSVQYATTNPVGSASAVYIRPNTCLPCILSLTTTDTFYVTMDVESGLNPPAVFASNITIVQIA